MNFARDVVDAADRDRLALVALARDGTRREIVFGEVADRSARLAASLVARGVGRGDVVITMVGNRPEWVEAMVACWRIGAVAQPCIEQLRPQDLRARIDTVEPRAAIVDERNLATLREAGFDGAVLAVPDERLYEASPTPAPDDDLARELQDHVKERTAPYEYPRIVEFADALPKTPSGKIKRAQLRTG